MKCVCGFDNKKLGRGDRDFGVLDGGQELSMRFPKTEFNPEEKDKVSVLVCPKCGMLRAKDLSCIGGAWD